MLSSEAKRFAFVHVQKTGGASVAELLRETVPDITFHGPRHMGAPHARKLLPDWDERFTFAFVRNPFDRLVSWYSMIEQSRRRHQDESWQTSEAREKRQGRLERNPLLRYAVEVLDEDNSFEAFVKRCTGEFRRGGVVYSFTRNQADYLCGPKERLLVDFVGRFEQLHADLSVVLRKIGVEAAEIPHRNPSERKHYREYYTPETREIVTRKFARDMEVFGYEFDTRGA